MREAKEIIYFQSNNNNTEAKFVVVLRAGCWRCITERVRSSKSKGEGNEEKKKARDKGQTQSLQDEL